MPLPRKPVRSAAPEASFDPGEFSQGFQVPDGDYNITSCVTGSHTYGGTVPGGVPAFLVVYEDDNGGTYEQPYKAGDNEHLTSSEDGETFVHPDGQSPAKIYGNGAAAMWLKSWKDAGHQFTGNAASQFQGLRVRLVSTAAPKGKTSENPDRTIPVIAKILEAAKGRPSSRPTTGRTTTQLSPSATAQITGRPPAPSAAASSRPAPASRPSDNGELDADAMALVVDVLEHVADNTLPIPKLANHVYMKATKDPKYKANARAIMGLITPDFLDGKAGIVSNGEDVALES